MVTGGLGGDTVERPHKWMDSIGRSGQEARQLHDKHPRLALSRERSEIQEELEQTDIAPKQKTPNCGRHRRTDG